MLVGNYFFYQTEIDWMIRIGVYILSALTMLVLLKIKSKRQGENSKNELVFVFIPYLNSLLAVVFFTCFIVVGMIKLGCQLKLIKLKEAE